MSADATYHILHRAGRWDEALAALPAEAHAQRAEILVDRHWWRLDDAGAAAAAIQAVGDSVLAGYLDAQLRYTRVLFDLDPRPDDREHARDGFTAAVDDARLTAWATFWLGVLTENAYQDPDGAGPFYRRAFDLAGQHDDTLLESYAVRHLGFQLLDKDREQGILQLRRSYHLRAALGARPQTAAAAAALAGELEPGPEADQLREAALLTARELRLTWLQGV